MERNEKKLLAHTQFKGTYLLGFDTRQMYNIHTAHIIYNTLYAIYSTSELYPQGLKNRYYET